MRRYWTRARVLDGLKRFYRVFTVAPGSSVEMWKLARQHKSGSRNAFPPPGAVLAYFKGMYEAWESTGIEAALPHCECGAVLKSFRVRCCQDCAVKHHSAGSRKAAVRRRKYFPTPEIDELIRQTYQETRRSAKIGRVRALAARIGWPRHVVCHRARDLGLTAVKEPKWSPAELELLERFVYLTPQNIRKRLKRAGFVRTEAAINLKVKRADLRKESPVYSATQLAKWIGEDAHKVIRWMKAGLLVYERKSSSRKTVQGGDPYIVHDVDVYLFLVTHRGEYDIRKCDQEWLLSTLIEFPAVHQNEIDARRQHLSKSGRGEARAPSWSTSKWKQRKPRAFKEQTT